VLTEPPERPQTFGRNDLARLVLAGVLILLALASGVILDISQRSPVLLTGAIAPSAVRAPRDATIPNDVETHAAAAAAALAVEPQYDFSPAGASLKAAAQVAALKAQLAPADAIFASNMTATVRATQLQQIPSSLSSSDRAVLAALTSDRWTLVEQAAASALSQAEQVEIRVTDPVSQVTLATQYVPANLGLTDPEKLLAVALAAPMIVTNSAYSAAITTQARQKAAQSVPTVSDTVQAGQILVDEGHVITEADMVRISYFGLQTPHLDWGRSGAWLLIASVATILLLAWMWRFRHDYWSRGRTLVLIGGVFVVAVLLERIPGGRAWIPFLVPAAAAGILVTLLLDAGMATVILALLAVLAGMANGQSLELAAYVFLGGFAGMLAIGRGDRAHPFLVAGVAVAAADLGVIVTFGLLGAHDTTAMLQLAAAALGCALLSAVIALGSFALLGNLFGILTPPQLLELANPSQPVLRRLLTETPGTYHHSLRVGNLAERAANAIGADPLLTRVAAYYHDIGKMANPLAFIENQAGGDNIHDQLEPEVSATILRQHVSDGMDIAAKAGLPKPLIAFIPQHHGTAVMGYLYGKARDGAAAPFGGPGTDEGRAAADVVAEDLYRHGGPKPQSREAALIMLADGVEASVRSLSSRDDATIRAMVKRIVTERLEDGQLDDCDLTIRDLEHIQEAFVGQLQAMYHQRIAYPQSKVVELEAERDRSQQDQEGPGDS
jgi:putative nucleotidyltransferase with HDIG domain